uniref:Innexin n=1 Tax=Heterorhabditis bacteriophora TaxID=37862 RepID=A0A1I7XQG5_HETBA
MNLLGSAVTAIKPRLDDSGTDRLNYYYSTVVIMALSITITAKQYVGSPLQCWVPAQFTKAWEQYAENYCFVYNTYWVPPEENVPKSVEARITQQLIYYQWVPFIMALEAAFFYLPVLFWGQMSNKSGLNIENLIRTAQNAETEEGSEREKKVAQICGHFEDSIRLQMARRDGATLFTRITKFGKLDGTYISKFVKHKADEELLMKEFCLKVNSDMIILLSMISGHANEIITTEILQQLWESHKLINNGLSINVLINEEKTGKQNGLSPEAKSLIYN